jgi:hypothetical protein
MLKPGESDDLSQQMESMRSRMESLIHALVESREGVVIESTVLVVKAAPSDAGKIIGKKGQNCTISSHYTQCGFDENQAQIFSGHSARRIASASIAASDFRRRSDCEFCNRPSGLEYHRR